MTELDPIQLTADQHRELDQLERIYKLQTRIEYLEDIRTAALVLRRALEENPDRMSSSSAGLIEEALLNLRGALRVYESPNG
jgi:hypothetical protein